MPTPRPYRSLSQLIRILIVLSASSCVCAKSTYENEGGAPFNRTTLAHHYFFHEIDFLVKQSMILGNYHGDVDKATSSGSAEGRIHRLRFLEKSLLVELDYIRQLEDMSRNPDEILRTVDATECFGDETMGCSYDEMRYKQDSPSDNVIANVMSRASWPALVPRRTPKNSPPQNKSMYHIDHKYNFDRAMKRGFGRMYDDLNCYDHATDQNKPMYTPEMWRRLWEIFQDSTLFPFPIPDDDECPEEPSYAGHTTDGKGRGIFASRNITKGSLVHPGHPNTVFFLDSTSWHRFVSSLPKMFACDTMEWVWQQDMTDSGNLVLCLNMDKAAFYNDGGKRCNIEMKESASLDFYASKDIYAGQELLYDYSKLGFDTSDMDL